MASRAVPEQPIVVGGKPKNGQADGRNRRVLGDIGNLVPAAEGKVSKTNITRPVTRNFTAQLLANAQAAAEKNNTKKPLRVAGVPSGRDVKKQETMVGISPEEEAKLAKNLEKKATISKRTGTGKSLTSTLSARSKAACGITKKPVELVVDIDAADVSNELAAVEYVEDIYKFYKMSENEYRVHDYMSTQPEINSKMRAILVDWLIEVHRKFELMPETLYLSINIVDRFLSVKAVPRKELQLVGISSMLIACKYEEIWAPEVQDFLAISDNAYVREQMLLMEKAILGKLEWYMTVPTPYVFLARYIKASVPTDQEMENMTFFFAELGVTHYSTSIFYCPSKLAASSVYAARCTLKKSPFWSETLKHHTGYVEDELTDCAKLLVSYHLGASESRLKAVYKKYSSPDKGAVALFRPAKTLQTKQAAGSV
ncbi:hypothetical protein Leryth_008346 [Lithospermum erythrorhizon]|uniref:Kinase activator n=1 Tax=Lithospermum erythrorhizon TaxID=34254 RepID=A0AAV3QMU0_LITER|nr:hypothetical protein Leryth_008346 [Lithospermum erythrorhizon]